jgi:SAM-dependent methyltransferase
LERHRIVRAAFNSFPGSLFAGTRCLQFSPDPALNRLPFREVVVSVWGGENSLDLQAIALPDASFDWVYSSHVINHVPDTTAALKEMLRVVGNGCVVLNVGGTAFSFLTANSERFCGPDRQFKVYGTMYADELQDVLPQVAVLEVVAVDPCSITLDAVYFASLDEQRLVEMANAATASNVHARVFPARQPVPVSARVPTKAPALTAWDALEHEVQAWLDSGGSGKLWVRDDDATTAEPRLLELIELCKREAVPLTMAIIPLPMTVDLVGLIADQPHVTPIQHGFDHQNREESTDKPKSEFPTERATVEALRSIQLGWYILHEAFGERALPVFCPPWGTLAPKFQDRLQDLGFAGYSGSRVASEIYRRGTRPTGLSLAGAHVAVNRTRRSGGPELADQRILEILTATIRAIRLDGSNEPVGIMTHHWGVDEGVRHFLQRLFDVTRGAGATWTNAQELFGLGPAARTQPLLHGASLASAGGASI